MTLRHRSKSRKVAFVWTATLVGVVLVSCGGSKKSNNEQSSIPPNATGGTTGNLLGNSGGAADVSGGGAETVGSAGSGAVGTGEAGTAGTSPTEPSIGNPQAAGGAMSVEPVVICDSDLDCKPTQMLCSETAGVCVLPCREPGDCKNGSACVGGKCESAAGCTSNADCAASANGKACDTTRGRCVACVVAADCGDAMQNACVRSACVALTTCDNSLGCTSAAAPVCDSDKTPARCVRCFRDGDCATGEFCENNQCRVECNAGSKCPTGMLCNTSQIPNYCATCATNADCPAEKYCSGGDCVTDICVAGNDQACINNRIVKCNAEGDGFGGPVDCASGQTCTVADSRANCVTGATIPTTPATPTTTCESSPGTVDPCMKIPRFTGTQIVDAKGEDFCTVPMFELNFQNAKSVNNNKATGGSVANYKQRALAQVAWSEQTFHAFVEVIGTAARSNTSADKPWDGDAVELMITTSNSVTGLTSKDSNTLHLILNYGVGVTVTSDGAAGTHKPISDASQFKGQKTSQGYTVEVKIPWPGGITLTSATAVRFDMAMNVDTESVDPTVQGRDAQAVLAMTSLTGSSSCASSPAAPFCDDRLWCPTTLE